MKQIGRFFTSLLGSLLGFLGLTQCAEEPMMAYMGPPPSVHGKVLDSASTTALSNIRIELLQGATPITNGRTDSLGEFHYHLNYGDDNKSFTLRITDTDGAANGGEYQGKTNTFHLDYSTNATIELEKKP